MIVAVFFEVFLSYHGWLVESKARHSEIASARRTFIQRFAGLQEIKVGICYLSACTSDEFGLVLSKMDITSINDLILVMSILYIRLRVI